MRALVFAIAIAATGCAGTGGSRGTPSKENRSERKQSEVARQQKQLPGAYSCRFEARDENLDDASCAISGGGDTMQLTMSGGDHRLSGKLAATDAGFRLVGEYTCSAGDDCKQSVETDFFEQTKGQYQGTIALDSGKLLSVTLEKL